MATASALLADSFLAQGVNNCYGITGFPIIQLSFHLHSAGVKFYGFRNEQAAAYAAGVEGYLTGRPGLCVTVSGPGFTNALSGVINAKENSWPMILISGSSESWGAGMGSFQEFPQSAATLSFFKWSVRLANLSMIPRVVHKAVNVAINGRPGPVYIDLPADVLRLTSEATVPVNFPRAVKLNCCGCPEDIRRAASLLRSAERPLVIIGKGAAYARAEDSIRILIEKLNFPFLATPMGKGVVSDLSKQCVNPARSAALKNADVILLLGARLNWILHFGLPPRFSESLKVIHVNIDPEEINNNVQATIGIQGDVRYVVPQLISELANWKFTNEPWWALLQEKILKNTAAKKQLLSSTEFNYYHALNALQEALPQDCLLVCEGANTMDIARTVIHSYAPRSRIDAGAWGTMGVALPACFAAKVTFPEKRVVAVVGDSSFGFSALELDTFARFNLDVTIFIVNNNGIATGTASLSKEHSRVLPSDLNPAAKYQLLAEAFGGTGFEVDSLEQLREVAPRALLLSGVTVVNIRIAPSSGKKPQEHFWLTVTDPKL